MTDIKIGDRVRATSKTNDDTAEFTVVTADDFGVESVENAYSNHSFDFEVLASPLPTKPGLYTFHEHDTSLNKLKRLVLTTDGDWYALDFTAHEAVGVLAFISKEVVASLEPTLVYSGTD